MSEPRPTYTPPAPLSNAAEPLSEFTAIARAELDRLRSELAAAERKVFEQGAELGELDNELVGCREVSFKAQRELAALRKRVGAQVAAMTTARTEIEAHCKKGYLMCGDKTDLRRALVALTTALAEVTP